MAALWATGRRVPYARVAALAIAVLATAAATVVVGLPARLLSPSNWPELIDNLGLGLAGIEDTDMPYDGGDVWLRLTLLLGRAAVARPRRGVRVLARPPPGAGAGPGAGRPGGPLRHRGHPRLSRRRAALGPVVVVARRGVALGAAAPAPPGGGRGRHGRRRRAAGASSGRGARPGHPLVGLRELGLVRPRAGGDLRLEPLLRPARLAPGGHHPARGAQRRAALLEGERARSLRRIHLAARDGRRRPRGPRALRPPAVAGRRAPRASPQLAHPGELRGPSAPERCRDRSRGAAGDPGGRRGERQLRRHDERRRRAAVDGRRVLDRRL